MEKNSWELHERRMKEQYLMAISEKDQQLGHLQSLLRELRSSSQTQILPAHDQRQFSQLLEEKNVLSTQLSDASQSLREHQHHYSNLSNHCAILEEQVQKLQEGRLNGDAAPGAPQKNDEINRRNEPETTGEEQPSFSEVQQQLCTSKQELSELQKLLEEERDGRLTAENALSLAKEQIQRLELSEWDSARTPIIGACGSQEQVLLMDLPGSSCRRTRSSVGWKRVLRSLCHSRTRVPLLAAVYFLMIHVLLVLCFTGHL